MKRYNIEEFKGSRIAAIDYGKRRIGFAVCDEFHITVNPKFTFDNSKENIIDDIINEIKKENARFIIIGVPYRLDELVSEFMQEIEDFAALLELKTELPVIRYDESYSTHRSVAAMIEIGKKKKKRAEKGYKDQIAAAIILQDFLQELES
ncbi:MAG: Holliday junction resolvase RuvX [Bacteroidota bacterium]